MLGPGGRPGVDQVDQILRGLLNQLVVLLLEALEADALLLLDLLAELREDLFDVLDMAASLAQVLLRPLRISASVTSSMSFGSTSFSSFSST